MAALALDSVKIDHYQPPFGSQSLVNRRKGRLRKLVDLPSTGTSVDVKLDDTEKKINKEDDVEVVNESKEVNPYQSLGVGHEIRQIGMTHETKC